MSLQNETLKAFSVSQLTDYIAARLKADPILSEIVVVGEVSNFGVSGPHGYFALKDAGAVINCVYWRISKEAAAMIKDGQEIVVCGRIDLYKKGGRYNLVVSRFEPVGMGTLAMQFEQLKKKLGDLGYFALEHKKPIPKLPKTVGVVTSPTGAALQDILRVAKGRFGGVEIRVYPAKVQGVGAALQVAAGVRYFNRHPVDVIIVARGGGSYEELFEFNHEQLVYAIYESEIPVVSGVGHEVDVSLCDLAADLRAATPSNAAELTIPKKETILDGIALLRHRMSAILNDALLKKRQEITVQAANLAALSPKMQVEKKKQELLALKNKLQEQINYQLIQKKNQCNILKERLLACDLVSILNRGYAIARKKEKAISSIKQVDTGDEIAIQLKDGKIYAVVMRKEG